MLGKLVKHEWKGTYRVGCLMLLVVAIVTFFGWLAFQAPMWQMLAGNNSSDRISALDPYFKAFADNHVICVHAGGRKLWHDDLSGHPFL